MKAFSILVFSLFSIFYSFGQHSKDHPHEIDPWIDTHEIFSYKNSQIGFAHLPSTDSSDFSILTKLFRYKIISPSDFIGLNDLDSLGKIVMAQPFLMSADSVKILDKTNSKNLFYFSMINIYQGDAKIPEQEMIFELTFTTMDINDLKSFKLSKIKYIKTVKFN